jgi:glycosyltransferase involved in cell wall biosynthesis
VSAPTAGAAGNDRPDVTVVIPTHTRWPLLRRTLGAVLGQEDVDFEVIVVDDGSRDETPRELAALGDQRVRTHRHETPMGVAVARNAGIERARAPWIAFTDDDDLWSPRKLRAQLDELESAGATWGYGAGLIIDHQVTVIDVFDPPPPSQVAARLISSNVVPGGCSDVMARTDAVREIGGFDPSFQILADYDFFLRLSRTGPAAMYPGHEMAYVLHAGNMSVTDVDGMVAEFERLRAKHAAAGIDLEAAPLWRWIAYNLYRRSDRSAAARAYLRAALRYGDRASIGRALVVLLGRSATERALRIRRREPTGSTDWLETFRAPAAAAAASAPVAPPARDVSA